MSPVGSSDHQMSAVNNYTVQPTITAGGRQCRSAVSARGPDLNTNADKQG